jgi:hypothetical protein
MNNYLMDMKLHYLKISNNILRTNYTLYLYFIDKLRHNIFNILNT